MVELVNSHSYHSGPYRAGVTLLLGWTVTPGLTADGVSPGILPARDQPCSVPKGLSPLCPTVRGRPSCHSMLAPLQEDGHGRVQGMPSDATHVWQGQELLGKSATAEFLSLLKWSVTSLGEKHWGVSTADLFCSVCVICPQGLGYNEDFGPD